VVLSSDQASALVQAFLTENAKLNLSAFRTEEHVRIGNIDDSLAFFGACEKIPALASIRSFIDLGTGGGFPLLPLAMALPDARAVGVDSIGKKVAAVQRMVDVLELTNIELLSDRIEELGHNKKFRGQFDLVTARALAPLNVLLEYAVPLLKEKGICAFWKSTKIAHELAETASTQKLLHVRYIDTYTYTLPGDWGSRSIVFFQKIAPTPAEYPRAVGTPKNSPL